MSFLQARGVYIVFLQSLTPGFYQSNWGESGKFSSLVGLSVQLIRGCYGLSVRGLWIVKIIFPSLRKENYPDHKSGQTRRYGLRPVWDM